MGWGQPLANLPDGRRPVISSGYGIRKGRWHRGADIAYRAVPGDPAWPGSATAERTKSFYAPPMSVLAVAPGTVIQSQQPDSNPTIRGRVRVRHTDGGTTVYYHLEAVTAKVGDVVLPGSVLGVMGAAGDYPFRHLHLEWYPPGKLNVAGNQKDPGPQLREALSSSSSASASSSSSSSALRSSASSSRPTLTQPSRSSASGSPAWPFLLLAFFILR